MDTKVSAILDIRDDAHPFDKRELCREGHAVKTDGNCIIYPRPFPPSKLTQVPNPRRVWLRQA